MSNFSNNTDQKTNSDYFEINTKFCLNSYFVNSRTSEKEKNLKNNSYLKNYNNNFDEDKKRDLFFPFGNEQSRNIIKPTNLFNNQMSVNQQENNEKNNIYNNNFISKVYDRATNRNTKRQNSYDGNNLFYNKTVDNNKINNLQNSVKLKI